MVALGLGDFPPGARTHPHKEDPTMSENENAAQWEDRFEEEKPQIANMDQIDFMTLLMESRIIQAS